MTGRLLADLTPLRTSVTFRRFWVSGLLSGVGNQMTNFAVILQVYRLTHSSLDVGLIGLFTAVPAITVGLAGGVLIDVFDRRRLVLCTSTILMAVSVLYTLQAAAGLGAVWLLYLLSALEGGAAALNLPARTTITVGLLPGEQLQAGMALVTLAFRGSMVFGPALAGLLAATGGLTFCYLVDAIGFVVAMFGIVTLPPMPPAPGVAARLSDVIDGFRVLRRSSVLSGALLADLNATFLAMPVALFPAINAERFGGSPSTLGLLTTAIAVGGIIASALSGPLARVRSQGRGMLLGGAVWGAAIAGFGLASSLWVALLMLALAGAADVASVVMRMTIIQLASPASYRGRINATDYAVGAGFPQLGNFRAGVVGSLTSPSASAVLGGIASLFGTIAIGLAIPALAHYRGEPAPNFVETAGAPVA